MNKPDHNSNKPNSNSVGLNLPALTKQLSDQLTDLDKFSLNSHKQFQDLLIISKNIFDSLTKLNSIIQKSNLALDTLSSPENGLSSIKDNLSTFDATLSTQLQKLETFSSNLEKLPDLETFSSNLDLHLSTLSKINDELAFILKDEKKRIGLTKNVLDKLATILGSQRDLLEEIKSLVQSISKSNPKVNEKIDSFDKKLSQSVDGYNENLAIITNNLKLLPNSEKNSKDARLGVLILLAATILLSILSSISIYFNYSISKQLDESRKSIDQRFLELKSIPTPDSTPSPSPSPKSEKKR